MDLFKLVIVDDEPILLQGLVDTYDWESMGFEVAGSARSGEGSIRMILELQPDVVLTDIRMKQITGLMVMERIRDAGMDCLFIVLSAYRDFSYAQQACSLGAFDYLLKPIGEEKLRETMKRAREACMKKTTLKKLLQPERKERDALTDAAIPEHYRNYMEIALDYIEAHLEEEDLSIVSVATQVYLNPVYFGRIFKNTFQMTFKQYVLRQRMERAKLLLVQKNSSIGMVCGQVGIGNPSYFSHLFKEYTGMLPSEYKYKRNQ